MNKFNIHSKKEVRLKYIHLFDFFFLDWKIFYFVVRRHSRIPYCRLFSFYILLNEKQYPAATKNSCFGFYERTWWKFLAHMLRYDRWVLFLLLWIFFLLFFDSLLHRYLYVRSACKPCQNKTNAHYQNLWIVWDRWVENSKLQR